MPCAATRRRVLLGEQCGNPEHGPHRGCGGSPGEVKVLGDTLIALRRTPEHQGGHLRGAGTGSCWAAYFSWKSGA